MPTVLIVESDLGFVFWLGQVLLGAGYEALPAKGVADASALVRELKAQVDVLIVNPSLAGASNLVKTLRRSRGDLKVMAVLSDTDQQPPPIPHADAEIRKPLRTDRIAGFLWIRSVEQLLARRCTV